MEFLPEDFKVPTGSGNYYKLEDGDNRFRIMSSAIVGHRYWTNDGKPVRSKQYPQTTPNIRVRDGKTEKVKHFWAFVVWNYDAKKLQILELTQPTIQTAIKAIVDNPKWGDPKTYDLTIKRSGEGFDTEYTVVPDPKSEVPLEAEKAFEEARVDLNALYSGADPFDPNWVASDAIPATA